MTQMDPETKGQAFMAEGSVCRQVPGACVQAGGASACSLFSCFFITYALFASTAGLAPAIRAEGRSRNRNNYQKHSLGLSSTTCRLTCRLACVDQPAVKWTSDPNPNVSPARVSCHLADTRLEQCNFAELKAVGSIQDSRRQLKNHKPKVLQLRHLCKPAILQEGNIRHRYYKAPKTSSWALNQASRDSQRPDCTDCVSEQPTRVPIWIGNFYSM